MVRVPPPSILNAVDRALPGIWPAFLGRLLDGVAVSRTRVGVSSWYRDPVANRQVGGSVNSQHQLGLAVDLVTDNPLALEAALDAQGIVAVREPGHVHVQAYAAGLVTPLIRQIYV